MAGRLFPAGHGTNSVGHSKVVRRQAKGLGASDLVGRMGFIRDGQPLLCLFLLAGRRCDSSRLQRDEKPF